VTVGYWRYLESSNRSVVRTSGLNIFAEGTGTATITAIVEWWDDLREEGRLIRSFPVTVNVQATVPQRITIEDHDLSATSGNRQATLNWIAPNDGGSAIIRYEVRRRTSPSGSWTAWSTTGSTGTSHTVGGLDNGTEYEFQVRAVNIIGNALESDSVSAIPEMPVAGTPTANLPSGVIPSGTMITLSTYTVGASIRFTTDGSEPTATSTLYTAPIPITASTTIRARAFATDMTPSNVATFTYLILEDTPAIIVGTVQARPDSTVDVPVRIANNPGMAMFDLKLDFDGTMLEVVSVTQGAAVTTGAIMPNIGASSVGVFWYSLTETDVDGTLFTVRFRIKDDVAVDEIPLLLTINDAVNSNFGTVDLLAIDGKIEIPDFIHGDVTGTGSVTGNDVLFLAQYVAGWFPDWETPPVPQAIFNRISYRQFRLAADVFADGVINGRDVLLLAQYVAGWDVVIPTVPAA
jgi:hypothetical protein